MERASDHHPFLDHEVVRRLVDDGMVLFLAIDGTGQVEWVGESVRSILGRAPEDLTGTSALDLVHPHDVRFVLETLAEDARGAEGRILAVIRLRRVDGSWATLEFGGLDLREADGTGTFLVWGRSYESSGRLLAFLGTLLESSDLGRLLDEVVRWSDTISPGGHTALVVQGPHGHRVAAAADALPPALGSALTVGFDGYGPLEVPAAGTTVEVSVDDLEPTLAAAARAAGMHAVWLVPVDEGDGGPPQGVVAVWRSRPGPMRASHTRHYAEVAKLARLALAWSTTRAELQAAASTDPLTGVANRAQLAAAIAGPRTGPAALLFCDLDDFKAVNDQHGHVAGDRVLLAVAARMAGTARPGDLLVRLGGDEFAVWCPGIRGVAEGEALAQQMVTVLDEPVLVEGTAIRVGCSVGLAIVDGPTDRPPTLDQVLGRADRALYRAKRSGKHRWAAEG